MWWASCAMAGITAVTRLSCIMMCLLTLAGLPIISALVEGGVAQPVEKPSPRVTHCELYNSTQCLKEGPQPDLCSGKTTQTCEVWDSPEKINQCFVLWTNNSGKAGTYESQSDSLSGGDFSAI